MGLVVEVLQIVDASSGGAPVKRIILEVGKLAAVLPDAMRFCFELAKVGTVAEAAELEIIEVPGSAQCRLCGELVLLERAFGTCACGSTDLLWLSGEELRVKSLEVT